MKAAGRWVDHHDHDVASIRMLRLVLGEPCPVERPLDVGRSGDGARSWNCNNIRVNCVASGRHLALFSSTTSSSSPSGVHHAPGGRTTRSWLRWRSKRTSPRRSRSRASAPFFVFDLSRSHHGDARREPWPDVPLMRRSQDAAGEDKVAIVSGVGCPGSRQGPGSRPRPRRCVVVLGARTASDLRDLAAEIESAGGRSRPPHRLIDRGQCRRPLRMPRSTASMGRRAGATTRSGPTPSSRRGRRPRDAGAAASRSPVRLAPADPLGGGADEGAGRGSMVFVNSMVIARCSRPGRLRGVQGRAP